MNNTNNNFDCAVIIGAGIQQRVAKTADSFIKRGIPVKILAEENAVQGLFDNYLEKVEFIKIETGNSFLKRTPIGEKRKKQIKESLKEICNKFKRIIIIARDVNYGYIVGKILHKINPCNVVFLTDVADNYDLLYDSYSNVFKKLIYKIGFRYITKYAFRYSNGIITVCPINKPRLYNAYKNELANKMIFVLRNVPVNVQNIENKNKIDNSFVYVGKIDEISRDPMYIINKIRDMNAYTIHFYSAEKKSTIEKIKKFAINNNFENRIFFHERVPYDLLAVEISKYKFGLVPHKRRMITDYTLPNKMYDYRSSGVIAIMSDCPSLVSENEEFSMGLIYSKEIDNFKDIVNQANDFKFDDNRKIPTWEEEFSIFYSNLCDCRFNSSRC